MTPIDKKFLKRAIELARQGMQEGRGGPFGCVIVKNGEVVGEGSNNVLATNDPTAHAEVVAIRAACKTLNSFQLTDCDVYASCEPCPMCLGAIYWSRPQRVIYANTKQDAAEINFDDEFIYKEILQKPGERKIPFIHLPDAEAMAVFNEWKNTGNKQVY